MRIFRFVVRFKHADSRSAGFLKDALAIEGQLSQDDLQQLALKLLPDPVTQTPSWKALPAEQATINPDTVMVEVSLRPGGTGPVALEIVR